MSAFYGRTWRTIQTHFFSVILRFISMYLLFEKRSTVPIIIVSTYVVYVHATGTVRVCLFLSRSLVHQSEIDIDISVHSIFSWNMAHSQTHTTNAEQLAHSKGQLLFYIWLQTNPQGKSFESREYEIGEHTQESRFFSLMAEFFTKSPVVRICTYRSSSQKPEETECHCFVGAYPQPLGAAYDQERLDTYLDALGLA